MRNSKFAIRNSKLSGLQPTAYSLQPGFTLAEMLVAVGMGVALVVAASGVFSLATQAVGSSQANTQINNKLRVLFSWLDRDFARIRLDGPLVLQPDTYTYSALDGSTPEARADRVFFVISGDIPSLTEPNYNASLAMVAYGQDESVNSVPAPNAFSTSLARRAGLIVANLSGITPPSPNPADWEILPWSFAALLSEWYTVPGRDWVPRVDLSDSAAVDLLYSQMMGQVLSFEIVRYYMAGDSGPIEYDSAEWPAGTDKAFGPADEKPAWIEFEIVLRDSNNQLKEGYTSTYRVNLPSR